MHGFRMAALFLAIGCATPTSATNTVGSGVPPLDALTGLPLPVLAGEKLVRLADGCHVVVDAADTFDRSKTRWLGACRFGLVHGQGVMLDPAAKRTDFFLEYRFGKYFGPKYGSGLETFTGPDTSWNIEIHDSPEAARDARNRPGVIRLPEMLVTDDSWFTTVASIEQRGGGADEGLRVGVSYTSCPMLSDRIDTAPVFAQLRFSAEATRVLAPFCDAAYQRLKREGGRSSNEYNRWGSDPFKGRGYGYYYAVEFYRADAEGLRDGTWTHQLTPCPQLLDVTSCDPLWKPLVAPYRAIRDAERQRVAERERGRDQMIHALEAAFAAKLALHGLPAAPGSNR